MAGGVLPEPRGGLEDALLVHVTRGTRNRIETCWTARGKGTRWVAPPLWGKEEVPEAATSYPIRRETPSPAVVMVIIAG